MVGACDVRSANIHIGKTSIAIDLTSFFVVVAFAAVATAVAVAVPGEIVVLLFRFAFHSKWYGWFCV